MSQDPFRIGTTVSWRDPSKIEKQSIVDALVEASVYASGRLLDIGCGRKPYRDLFAGRVTHHIGVDFPVTAAGAAAADVYADSTALPFADVAFDTVLSTQVLEHLPEPKAMLREACRVLRPGGHLILTAPQTWGLHEEPHDYYRFTCYGLRYLAEACGFGVDYIKPRGGLFALIGQLLINDYYRRRPWRQSGRLRRWLGIALVWIFAHLETLYSNRSDTLGYVMVMHKNDVER